MFEEEIIKSINQGKNVFITGGAGTGKSHLIKIIKSIFNDVIITASTGIAATNISGVTLHSWAGIGFGDAPTDNIIHNLNLQKSFLLRKKLRKARILAIDEISMISANFFDTLNIILKNIRNNDRAFGGIQLIVIGDFLQLPPINIDRSVEKKFCFESNSWMESDFRIFYLKKIYRQNNPDFAKLLSRLRIGELSNNDISILKSRVNIISDNKIRPTMIVTHNKQLDIINEKELSKLKSDERIYHIDSSGDKSKIEYLKRNSIAQATLVLKINSQVMMLKNSLQKDGIINGSIGIITSFSKDNNPIVKFENNISKEIEKDSWIIEEYDDISGSMVTKATITQIPLALAWAITIHKSQGMTLDKINCSLFKAFEEGQIYVAISRVKSIDGLFLDHFDEKLIKINKKAIEFYRNL